MEVFWERPAQGGQSEPIARFLSEQGLRSDSGVQATVSLQESGRILACGGLDGNVIKTTEMLALNIVNSNTSNSKGPGQAKAVVFFILVAIISIAQLVSTRKKEVDQ